MKPNEINLFSLDKTYIIKSPDATPRVSLPSQFPSSILQHVTHISDNDNGDANKTNRGQYYSPVSLPRPCPTLLTPPPLSSRILDRSGSLSRIESSVNAKRAEPDKRIKRTASRHSGRSKRYPKHCFGFLLKIVGFRLW
jgi:hypothetical protein